MTNKSNDEEQKQIKLIHKLAVRLPWFVVGISLFVFLIIFLQIYLLN